MLVYDVTVHNVTVHCLIFYNVVLNNICYTLHWIYWFGIINKLFFILFYSKQFRMLLVSQNHLDLLVSLSSAHIIFNFHLSVSDLLDQTFLQEIQLRQSMSINDSRDLPLFLQCLSTMSSYKRCQPDVGQAFFTYSGVWILNFTTLLLEAIFRREPMSS